jgi:hypothetical protein
LVSQLLSTTCCAALLCEFNSLIWIKLSQFGSNPTMTTERKRLDDALLEAQMLLEDFGCEEQYCLSLLLARFKLAIDDHQSVVPLFQAIEEKLRIVQMEEIVVVEEEVLGTPASMSPASEVSLSSTASMSHAWDTSLGTPMSMSPLSQKSSVATLSVSPASTLSCDDRDDGSNDQGRDFERGHNHEEGTKCSLIEHGFEVMDVDKFNRIHIETVKRRFRKTVEEVWISPVNGEPIKLVTITKKNGKSGVSLPDDAGLTHRVYLRKRVSNGLGGITDFFATITGGIIKPLATKQRGLGERAWRWLAGKPKP